MKRKLLWAALLLIVVAAIIGYRLYSKQEPDVTQKTPDEAVTASALVEAFTKDTTAAAKKYIDKIVEVSGTVKSVDTSGAVVMGEEGSASEVVVGLDRRHLGEASQLIPGASAVIQGICSGYTAGSTDTDDLLASLGITVQLRSGGIKKK